VNAFTPVASLAVRTADLSDPDLCRRIDAFADAGGTPFHRTAWSRAVERGCGQRAHYLFAEDGQGSSRLTSSSFNIWLTSITNSALGQHGASHHVIAACSGTSTVRS